MWVFRERFIQRIARRRLAAHRSVDGRERDKREQLRDLAQCGNCMFGCRVGGKQSAATTYLMDAIRSGAQIIAPYSARKLAQSKGKVTGVEGTYFEPQGPPRAMTIVAPRVVLAAGALETPALLM